MANALNFLSPGFSNPFLGCLLGGDVKGCLFTWIWCVVAVLCHTLVRPPPWICKAVCNAR